MESDRQRSDTRRRFRDHPVERCEPRLLRAAHVVGSTTSYATIQAAVNAAPVGGTVTVDAGTYAEQVTINKTLTVKGAQAGVDARGTARVSGTASTESVVTGAVSGSTHSAGFYIVASDVTVDGFTVTGETSQDDDLGAGVVIGPQVSGTHVLNDVITNNVSGLFLANYSTTDLALIQHCYIASNNSPGDNGGRGIYTNGEISGGNLVNVTIDANTFYNNHGGNDGSTTGLEAGIALEAGTAGRQSDIRITNNTFDGNGKATLFFNTTNCLIQGNTVTNCQDQYSGSLRFEGNNTNFTIRFNTVYNNTGPGVAVDSKGVEGDSSGFVVVDNNFYNNNTAYSNPSKPLYTGPISVAFDVDSYDRTFDARYNYWGSATGPSGYGPTGSGDSVGSGKFRTGGVGWALDNPTDSSVLYSSWATGTIAAPTGNNVYLKLAADGTTLNAWYNNKGTGTPDVSEPLSRLSMLALDPISAGPSFITVDYSNGNPVPAGGLSVSSAYGLATVGMVIIGSTGGSAVAVNATSVTVNTSSVITYTGLTTISVISSGADTITQSAQPGNNTTLEVRGTTSADTLAVTGGTYTIGAPAVGSGITASPWTAMTIGAGAKVVAASAAAATDRRVLRVGTLSDSGTLDLGRNDMILRGASLTTVTALARAGYANGAWTGTGLVSSLSANDTRYLTGVGVIQNVGTDGTTRLYATFDGQAVAATDVLVRDTYYGDLNLNGTVDAADYTLLDAGYLRGGQASGWGVGDVNYDQVVDGSDYTLVDNAFNLQAGTVGATSVTSNAMIATPVAEVASPAPATARVVTRSTRAIPLAPLGTDERKKVKLSRIVIDSLR